MSNVVVAVLLVTSVKNVTLTQIVAIISSSGSVDSCSRRAPMVLLKPELTKAEAMAMPAPNRMSIPQGIRLAVSQSSNFPPLPSGARNSNTTPMKATMASLV